MKHLAEGMGASVAVDSQVAHGACFTLFLPEVPPPSEMQQGNVAG